MDVYLSHLKPRAKASIVLIHFRILAFRASSPSFCIYSRLKTGSVGIIRNVSGRTSELYNSVVVFLLIVDICFYPKHPETIMLKNDGRQTMVHCTS